MKMEMATLKRVFAVCKGGNLTESLKNFKERATMCSFVGMS